MSDTTSRILRLLSLLQTHRDWSGTELAGRLEVSPRTIRRDIDRLRELGYPVHASAGVAGGYRLQAGASMPPLLLDDEEAVAIAMGLRFAAGGSVAGIDDASVRALAKVEQVLPSRLRRRVNALQTYTVPMTYGGGGPMVDPDTLICIVQACRDLERLRFDYTAKDGADTKRLVEPHRLVSAGRRWYLVCWDVDRHDWRTFRVDRLSDCVTEGIHFHPRELPAEDAAAYVQSAIASTYTKYPLEVRLRAPLSELKDKIRPQDGTLEEIDENTCLLKATGDSLEWMAAWMGWFGCDFEILQPPELVEYVRTLAGRLEKSTRSGKNET